MKSRIFALVASTLFISACGGSGGGGGTPTTPPPPPPPPTNTAPVVDAGADATIQLPTNSVDLDATVTDDGLPTGATVTTTWSVSSGPDGVVFADAAAQDTTVTFPGAGTYVLELTANDSELDGSDTVQIIVEPSAAANTAPVVDAGADATIQLPTNSVDLDGTVTDDGLPAGVTVTTMWGVSSGPAGAVFDDAAAVDTTVTFAGPGTYVLELTADDTELQGSDIVTVTVQDVANSVPTADSQAVTTQEDTPVAITLTGMDADGDSLTFAVTTQPTNGTLSGTAPNVTYAPNAGYSGGDSFAFTVNDGALTSAPATVTITVEEAPNAAPAADDQAVTTEEDTPVAITLTATDPDGDALTFAIDTNPSNGTLSGTPPNVTYTPNTGYSGDDSFTFTASDGALTSDPATVTITVEQDGTPTADAQSVTTQEDTPVAITLTATDPNGEALTFAIGASPTNGTLSGTAPDVTYTPNTGYTGSDSFTFTASDGVLTSDPATVSISVEAPPVSENEALWTFDEGAGTVAGDSLGDNDGTIAGAEHVIVGAVSGSALNFDSDDERVFLGSADALDITGTEISLVAWINPRNGGKVGASRIISKRVGAEGDNADVYGMALRNYRVRFMLDGGTALGGQEMESTNLIRIDDWTHVAMVYDGTDMRIYINGELDPTDPVAKSDAIDSSTGIVHLGRHERDVYPGSPDGRDFGGLLDEVRVLDRALTALEVADLYSQFDPPTPAGLYFTDFTDAVLNGIFPEAGQAVAFAPVTDDNQTEFAITGAMAGVGHGDHFYENINGSTFRERGLPTQFNLRDRDDDDGSHGLVWADLDNDGDYDQLNGSTWPDADPNPGTTGAPNGVHMNVYENPGSPSTSNPFVDNTDADILATALETIGVAAFDMDGDGDLDLFGVSDSDNPGLREAYLNDGGLAFTPHAGGDLTNPAVPATRGVTDTDYDGDGDIDIIAANRGTAPATDSEFTILNNNGSGVFTRVLPSTLGITTGNNRDEAQTGVTTADVDNDGDLDMLLSSPNGARLWRNDGGSYTLADFWGGIPGWTGAFSDLDNDGDQDLIFAGDDQVWENRGDGTFQRGQSIPVGGLGDPRSIAFGDIDNDGDQDFAISAQTSLSRLIRNDWDNAANNWLKVQLISANGQAGAFGAKVFVYEAGSGQSVLLGMREARSAQGYLSQSEPVLHFGLGAQLTADIVVRYVDGSETLCVDVAANARKLIDETAGDPCNP